MKPGSADDAAHVATGSKLVGSSWNLEVGARSGGFFLRAS